MDLGWVTRMIFPSNLSKWDSLSLACGACNDNVVIPVSIWKVHMRDGRKWDRWRTSWAQRLEMQHVWKGNIILLYLFQNGSLSHLRNPSRFFRLEPQTIAPPQLLIGFDFHFFRWILPRPDPQIFPPLLNPLQSSDLSPWGPGFWRNAFPSHLC